jgi:hypothetical protein
VTSINERMDWGDDTIRIVRKGKGEGEKDDDGR